MNSLTQVSSSLSSQASRGIQAEALTYAYEGNSQPVLNQLTFTLKAGSMTALLGPNGAGKSTLIKLLGGIVRPQAGSITLEGRPLTQFASRDLAKCLAYVPQYVSMHLPFTCLEVVAMGRFAHRRRWHFSDPNNEPLVEQCMRDTGIWHLADRPVTAISGGEAQRVRIAQALAQGARYLLLDEPTAHLDISYQVEIMDLLFRLNAERGLTVLAAIHDLNLASLYFGTLAVLEHGQIVTQGSPQKVLTESLLAEVFHVHAQVQDYDGRPHLRILPNAVRS